MYHLKKLTSRFVTVAIFIFALLNAYAAPHLSAQTSFIPQVTTPQRSIGPSSLFGQRLVAGTRGLVHSFDRHAAQWFGRQVSTGTHMGRWQKLIERAARSSKTVEWSTGTSKTIGHLARIDGKNFFVQFFKSGPRAKELATAFVPSKVQMAAILKLLK